MTGSDGIFCSGADIEMFDGSDNDIDEIEQLTNQFHEVLLRLHQVDAPIVGAINGLAAGGGFSLAIFPDIVIMSDEAELRYGFPLLGLTGDGGPTFSFRE